MLVQHLLQRRYTANIRELDAMLWRAMSESHGDVIEAPPELRPAAISGIPSRIPSSAPAPTSANDSSEIVLAPVEAKPEPGAAEIRAALVRHQGRVAEAARTLGLSSRYALYRLLKKHGIDPDAPV
jgi:transcriptional regulator of acetoin/glycerol metabolism